MQITKIVVALMVAASLIVGMGGGAVAGDEYATGTYTTGGGGGGGGGDQGIADPDKQRKAVKKITCSLAGKVGGYFTKTACNIYLG